MKPKFGALTLALLMCILFSACFGQPDTGANESTPEATIIAAVGLTPVPTPAPTPTPIPTPTPSPTPVPTPDGLYLAVCDLGTDGVYFYPVCADGLKASPHKVSTPPGSGPRHLVFGQGELWYLLTELSCELFIFRGYGDKAVRLVSYSLLLPGDAESTASSVCLSRDRGRLLAGVRGADRFVMWNLARDGMPDQPPVYQSTRGRWPRDAAFSPDGRYVFCACEHDNRITVFSVTGGSPAYLGEAEVASPTCICFTA